MVAMVADSATIHLLIQLQEEIGVLLYSGKKINWLSPSTDSLNLTVAKSATVATIQR